jgi:hypothetical protein
MLKMNICPRVIAKYFPHTRDPAFNISEFIKSLKLELKSWRKVSCSTYIPKYSTMFISSTVLYNFNPVFHYWWIVQYGQVSSNRIDNDLISFIEDRDGVITTLCLPTSSGDLHTGWIQTFLLDSEFCHGQFRIRIRVQL